MALFKGKSFKIGWDKGFQFYSPDANGPRGSLCINNITCGSEKDIDPLKVKFESIFKYINLPF